MRNTELKDADMDKEELRFAIRRLDRRIECRSPERVQTSMFFHFLFAMLNELNSRNEEELEEELKTGKIGFAGYYDPYKIKLQVEIQEVK